MTIDFQYPAGATPLDADDVSGLIPSHISTQGELNEAEQANIVQAQVWANARQHREVLTDTFARDVHRRMFGDVWRWAGKYRTTEKNIGVAPHDIPAGVRNLFADATYWIAHDVYPLDEIGARVHHRLVAVHAFPNGNGRHARLFTDILLRANGGQPFSWGALTHRADLGGEGEVRKAYIESLREADAGRYEKLFAFVRS